MSAPILDPRCQHKVIQLRKINVLSSEREARGGVVLLDGMMTANECAVITCVCRHERESETKCYTFTVDDAKCYNFPLCE
jgi:hypothetical protein